MTAALPRTVERVATALGDPLQQAGTLADPVDAEAALPVDVGAAGAYGWYAHHPLT